MWYNNNGNASGSSEGRSNNRNGGGSGNGRGRSSDSRGGFRGGSSSGSSFRDRDGGASRGGFSRDGGSRGGAPFNRDNKRPPIRHVVETELMPEAILPKYATEKSAGLDLYAIADVSINGEDFVNIHTGVKLFLANNRTIGEIRSRSSMAKNGLIITSSHVDFEDNGTEIIVKFFNLSKNTYTINKGDRIAQIVFNNLLRPEIEVRDTLDETSRNTGGFGSTGK